MANTEGLIPFKKGDPRINRKGRPKSFKALRDLVQSVGNEPAKDKNGEPLIIDGHIATVAEMIVRSWTKDPKRQRDFIEYGYGKVPNPVMLSDEDGNPKKIEVEYINSPHTVTSIPSEPTDNS